MNNKKFVCTDIEKLLDTFLYRELSPEDTKLFQEHIQTCSGCNKKLLSDLKIQGSLQAFYKEKTIQEIPPFDWNKFYTKLSTEGTTTKTPKFSWIPRFALTSLLAVLVISLSISIFFKVKNIRYINELKIPPRNDYANDVGTSNNKQEANSAPLDDEAYIKIEQKHSSKKRQKPLKNKMDYAAEQGKQEVHKESETLSSPTGIGNAAEEIAQAEIETIKTMRSIKPFAGLGGGTLKSQLQTVYSPTIADTDEKSTLINIPICKEDMYVQSTLASLKKQNTKKNCYFNDLSETPLTILGDAKRFKITIIEIIDPSCISCTDSYNTIKSIIDNHPNTISYKILFYPIKRKNALFFLLTGAIYAAGEDDKNNARIMLELILNEMKNDRDRQKRKSTQEWRKYIIKTAREITNLKKFLLAIRTERYKSKINQHIELTKSLKITSHSVLLFKDGTLMQYIGNYNQQSIEKTIQTLLNR